MSTPASGVAPKIDRFLRLMASRGASDFHLTVGRPPMLRVGGTMEPIRYRTILEADYVELVRPIVPENLWAEFTATGDADLAYEVPGLARFRVNLFRQQRGSGAVFRVIPTKIMTLEQLGMPEPVRRLAAMESGLVLVTGPTGSGKSTTLAAVINLINETRNYHVITIEDPIEFVHANKKCLIHQREIGTHATSFAEALKSAGREDPDLVLVGEMRDLETISMALSAAERAIEIVSRSRISPTRMRSGSSRPADLSASAKPVAWVPISRWWMRHFLFGCTNSIGSSMVMTW